MFRKRRHASEGNAGAGNAEKRHRRANGMPARHSETPRPNASHGASIRGARAVGRVRRCAGRCKRSIGTYVRIALVVGTLAAAFSLNATSLRSDMLYRRLSRQHEGTTGAQPNWPFESSVVAWLHVENTGIDYPVAALRKDDPDDFYLHHDAWGNPSPAGCLFLHRSCVASAMHALVYGHHMGIGGRMFNDIADAWAPARFVRIGQATWCERTAGESAHGTVFTPLIAFQCDEDDMSIQRFSFDGAGVGKTSKTDAGDERPYGQAPPVDDAEAETSGLRDWLRMQLRRASARAPDAESRIADAQRVLTLVTCSDTRAHGRMRTVVIFTV